MHDRDDPPALREVAATVATRAGAALTAHRSSTPGAPADVGTKSSGRDLVSEADRSTERMIVDALARQRPDDAVLGEEGATRRGTTGLRWVIDPLDGTTNYLYGLAAWSVSVAVERQGEHGWSTEAAAIHHPPSGETFAAGRGHGATLDGRRLAVTDPVALEDALVGTGFSYRTDVRRRQAEQVREVLPRVRDVRRLGSAALDLCYVAAGRLDGYFEDHLERWDWLGGALVAGEAGARVTPFGGGLLVAGPALHDALSPVLSGPGTAPAEARTGTSDRGPTLR